jgi:hypothetical protein
MDHQLFRILEQAERFSHLRGELLFDLCGVLSGGTE